MAERLLTPERLNNGIVLNGLAKYTTGTPLFWVNRCLFSLLGIPQQFLYSTTLGGGEWKGVGKEMQTWIWKAHLNATTNIISFKTMHCYM